jgi:hypothetical protein
MLQLLINVMQSAELPFLEIQMWTYTSLAIVASNPQRLDLPPDAQHCGQQAERGELVVLLDPQRAIAVVVDHLFDGCKHIAQLGMIAHELSLFCLQRIANRAERQLADFLDYTGADRAQSLL